MKNNNKHIKYFLGIGGIGMSALARYYNQLGFTIYGYDLTSTELTRQLENEGMIIHYQEDVSKIPYDVEEVIYTPAIPDSNLEIVYFKKHNFPLLKRAEVLGRISENIFTIAVAGSHGKTTVTSMITHLLENAGKRVLAFIGGISKDLNNNFLYSENPEFMVVEADEYDRSLLKLSPDIVIITSMDKDHLDIYNDLKDLEDTFISFASKLKNKGTLIYQNQLKVMESVPVKKVSYGICQEADISAANIKVDKGKFIFEVIAGMFSSFSLSLSLPGKHNVENCLAAIALGFQLDIPQLSIKKSIESYKGVERRFDIRISNSDTIFIDDYAHHPKEIESTLDSVKMFFPGKKITVAFQPHLYSRTRDFANEFAAALDKADEIILLDIYPARELPIKGVTSKIIFEKIKSRDKYILSKDELLKHLKKYKPEVFLTMGAGDINKLVPVIEKILIKE